MSTLLQDIRAAARSLVKAPGFAAAAIVTMALGIGVNAAIFSLVHGVLLSPLPYPDPDRLMFIHKDTGNYQRGPLSPRELGLLKRSAPLYQSIGGVWSVSGTLLGGLEPQSLRVAMVTSNFLEILRVPPARGRWLNAGDEAEEGATNAVISGQLWQRRFGGADVIGRRIRIEGGWGVRSGEFVIVGVMPDTFAMLVPDASIPQSVDIWVPFQGDWATGSGSMLRTIGRLGPDASVAAAQSQVKSVFRAGAVRRLTAVPLHADLIRDAAQPLLILQVAVGFVLVIAGSSVATLLLVRAQERRQEMAIRAAMGARRMRLARLLLTENLLLALAGGVGGIALAQLGLQVLPLLDSGTLPRAATAPLSVPVLAVSALMSLASGLFFGLAPLWDVWRGDLERPLRAGGRTGRGGPHQRARSLLVVSEVALSVVLLIGAGLLIRTFVNLQRFNAGFQTDRVLTFRLALPAERYAESAPAFAGELERALRALPGVEAAGIVNQLPLDDDPNYAVRFWTRGHAADTDAVPLADARLISPGYFETLQSTLVAGRWFTDRDDETAPLAVIVDERLARRAWPGGNPVGQEIRLQSAEGPWGHVVGVVRHLRHHRLSEEVREEVFVPFQQWPRNQMGVVVRSSLDRAALMSAITLRIRDIDANLAPARVRPLQDLAARSRAPARFNMILAAVFAGFSLLLACLSLYSIISYSAAQRTPELGVRAALGATSGDLIKAVAGHGAVLTLVGITLGLSAAVVVASSLEAMLFGVTTFDPRTFTGVPLVVAGTALLACYLPARRAARVDPMIALRRE